MDFPRQNRKFRELPLTPLIDVVFILIVFFMLTTSFMKTESLELMLPSAGGTSDVERQRLARIFIHSDGGLSFGGRRLEVPELNQILKTVFSENAEQRVVLFSAPNVSMQRLVDVMDMVHVAGGKSLFVREWKLPGTHAAPAGESPAAQP
uniref:Biopolymer transport protein ExbD/TolR n=1 Tax=uncultured bacterium CSL1 TaxID=1091565 RepID=G4WV92_9BACT|nr:biopolymer transport protein ExbD/TolR [uncultured bacterium CSL1]